VIQQNASASEEIASTAEELSSQAEQLQETISFFKVDEQKKSRASSPPKDKLRVNSKTVTPGIVRASANVYAKASGADLNMDDGRDRRDAEFEKF